MAEETKKFTAKNKRAPRKKEIIEAAIEEIKAIETKEPEKKSAPVIKEELKFKRAKVDTDLLNLRKYPSTGNNVSRILSRNTKLIILEGNYPSGWNKVKLEGSETTGFVMSEYITEVL